MLALQGPRTRLAGLEWRRFGQHILACAAFLLLFYLGICLLNLALSTIYGPAISCQSIWAENFSDVQLHLGSCVILLYAGGGGGGRIDRHGRNGTYLQAIYPCPSNSSFVS